MTSKPRARHRAASRRPEARERWRLRLYIAGRTARCVAAETNLRRICRQYLAGRCHVRVVDLLEDPRLGRVDQILAVPTLVRRLPRPERRVVGDLSNEAATLAALGLGPSPVSRT